MCSVFSFSYTNMLRSRCKVSSAGSPLRTAEWFSRPPASSRSSVTVTLSPVGVRDIPFLTPTNRYPVHLFLSSINSRKGGEHTICDRRPYNLWSRIEKRNDHICASSKNVCVVVFRFASFSNNNLFGSKIYVNTITRWGWSGVTMTSFLSVLHLLPWMDIFYASTPDCEELPVLYDSCARPMWKETKQAEQMTSA